MGPSDAEIDAMYVAAYRVAFRLLEDRGDAQDCAQEATARAAARWGRIREYGEAWTVKVATNLALGELRRRRRLSVMAAAPERQPGVLDPSDRVSLQSALQRLPRRQQQALVLRYLVDLSEVEVATALGCAPGTVKTHLKRGLVAMRRTLHAEEDS